MQFDAENGFGLLRCKSAIATAGELYGLAGIASSAETKTSVELTMPRHAFP